MKIKKLKSMSTKRRAVGKQKEEPKLHPNANGNSKSDNSSLQHDSPVARFRTFSRDGRTDKLFG